MVKVDSPWWQWYLNSSRLSFLCLCRNIILLIRNGGEFLFIVCRLWYFVVICTRRLRWLPFFYIYSNSFVLLVGGEVLIWDVMHF